MSGGSAKWIVSVLTLAFVAFASGGTRAAASCDGVDTDLSPVRKQEYAALVAKAVTAKIKPASVKVHNFMESAPWSAVYVSTPVGDDGVFFFEEIDGRKQFREVWGGWADPSEKPELVKWARTLGAPGTLAACFANVVTQH